MQAEGQSTGDLMLTEGEKLLQTSVREFAEHEMAPKAGEIDASEEFPWDNVKGMADLGLFGVKVDPAYGGAGGGSRQLAIVVEELARACPATSLTYIAHLSLTIQAIHGFGSEEQKQRYLPPLVRGEKLGAFCLTEPDQGSDAAGIQTRFRRDGDSYVLNGAKCLITNGSLAGAYVVFATRDPALRSRGISAFIVEGGAPGLQGQAMPGKMGMRASDTAQVFLEDVVVPPENRVGAEDEGFKIAMMTLDASRVGLAAQCVGIAQSALDVGVSYARERQAFGHPIADFQAIQFMLADMATRVQAARLLTRHTACLIDSGQPFVKEASMAKLFASEAASWCADRALQIHGGYGYFKPNPIERIYRDARITEIYEGTSEIQRLTIARQVLQQMEA